MAADSLRQAFAGRPSAGGTSAGGTYFGRYIVKRPCGRTSK